MTLSLADVLADPVMRRASPEVLAGEPAGRAVRWVHSSDIYAIAPLLRGGELLLTTGLGLEGSGPEARRGYVRGLLERGVAGLAIELGRTFRSVPVEMVEEARRVGLPLVALHDVTPFVEITEQVNGAIIDSSIVRLRHADEVGRSLSRVLADQGGVSGLVRVLARLTHRCVVLVDQGGAVLAVTGGEAGAVLAAPAATASVVGHGVVLGLLAIGVGDPADDALVEAALERAPEAFALEVLRVRPEPLLAGRGRVELFQRLLSGRRDDPVVLRAHAAAALAGPSAVWAGLALTGCDAHRGVSLAEEAARRAGLRSLVAEVEGVTYALLALPVQEPRVALLRLRSALDGLLAPTAATAAVGTMVGADAAGRSLRAARDALSLVGRVPLVRPTVLAQDVVAERLLARLPDRKDLEDLVQEELGVLLVARRGEVLLDTLEHYLAAGASKAATARVLHLRRQSVHQRLAYISALLDDDLDDPVRQTALRLAFAARRVLAGPGPGLAAGGQD